MPFMVISASDTNNVNLNAKADELRGLAPIWYYRMTTFDYKIAIIRIQWSAYQGREIMNTVRAFLTI